MLDRNPELSPREGKVLRYLTSRAEEGFQSTLPSQTINHIEWSDLPHNLFSAVLTLNNLVFLKLAKRIGNNAYAPTTTGIKFMQRHNKKWRT